VALNWSIEVTNKEEAGRWVSTLIGYKDFPMLIIDIFQTPKKAKLVRPADSEIEYAELEQFSKEEAIELAMFLRQHYKLDGNSSSWDSDSYLRYLQVAKI
jgi:predicted secreted protein